MFIQKLRKVMWNEKYLVVLLGLTLFCELQIVAKMWNWSRGNTLLYVFSAFENCMMMDLASSNLKFTYMVAGVGACIASCGTVYSEDVAAGGDGMLLCRQSKTMYHMENLIVSWIASFSMAIVPLGLNLAASLVCYPLEGMDNIYGNPAFAYLEICNPSRPLTMLHGLHPGRYVLLLIVMLGLATAAFSLLCYGLSVATRWNGYACCVASVLAYLGAGLAPYRLGYPWLSILSYMSGDDFGNVKIFMALIFLATAMACALTMAGARKS